MSTERCPVDQEPLYYPTDLLGRVIATCPRCHTRYSAPVFPPAPPSLVRPRRALSAIEPILEVIAKSPKPLSAVDLVAMTNYGESMIRESLHELVMRGEIARIRRAPGGRRGKAVVRYVLPDASTTPPRDVALEEVLSALADGYALSLAEITQRTTLRITQVKHVLVRAISRDLVCCKTKSYASTPATYQRVEFARRVA